MATIFDIYRSEQQREANVQATDGTLAQALPGRHGATPCGCHATRGRPSQNRRKRRGSIAGVAAARAKALGFSSKTPDGEMMSALMVAAASSGGPGDTIVQLPSGICTPQQQIPIFPFGTLLDPAFINPNPTGAEGRPDFNLDYVGVPGHFGVLPVFVRAFGDPSIVKKVIIAVHGADPPQDVGEMSHGLTMATIIFDKARTDFNVNENEVAILAPIFQHTWYKPTSVVVPWSWYFDYGPYSWAYGNGPETFQWCHLLREFKNFSTNEAVQHCGEVLWNEVRCHYRVPVGYSAHGPSSFRMLDEVVRLAINTYPQADFICVVGHSMGGANDAAICDVPNRDIG